MRNKRTNTFLLLLLASLSFVASGSAQTGDIAVIVNPQNSVSNLSTTELRKIFAGQKRSWNGGGTVKLIVRAQGSPERTALLRLLGMSESDYRQYWTAQVVRGEADSEPVTIPSFGMVKEAVKIYPGIICLVAAQDVRPGMEMKVVKIEGRSPGEAGYPLH